MTGLAFPADASCRRRPGRSICWPMTVGAPLRRAGAPPAQTGDSAVFWTCTIVAAFDSAFLAGVDKSAPLPSTASLGAHLEPP